ncbi:MAG: smalltalk protein [Bacteroidales bacterium]|nr:smalltalk protein [Bacteroidales bacterium]
MKKETLKKILHIIVTIITSVITTLGTTSCMVTVEPPYPQQVQYTIDN